MSDCLYSWLHMIYHWILKRLTRSCEKMIELDNGYSLKMSYRTKILRKLIIENVESVISTSSCSQWDRWWGCQWWWWSRTSWGSWWSGRSQGRPFQYQWKAPKWGHVRLQPAVCQPTTWFSDMWLKVKLSAKSYSPIIMISTLRKLVQGLSNTSVSLASMTKRTMPKAMRVVM